MFVATQFSYHNFSSKSASLIVALLVAIMFKVAATCTKHTISGNLCSLHLSIYFSLYKSKAVWCWKHECRSLFWKKIIACAFITCQMKTTKPKFSPNFAAGSNIIVISWGRRRKCRGRPIFNDKATCMHVKLFYCFYMLGRNIMII